MEYSAEVLKIIEGSLKSDKEKVINYTKLLISKLIDGGEGKLAERLKRTLVGANKASISAVSLDSNYRIPVDAESRLTIADFMVPDEIEENAVFLNKSCEEQINLFFEYYKNKNAILNNGINLPNTLIFYGPPGCGKSKLAQYVAKETKLPLVTTRLDGLISSYLGSTAKNIRAIFEYASNMPCVLFLDEFDAIAKIRDDVNELGELKRIVNSLLQNIDGMKNGSIIIAATNHDKLLDPAVWRRFMFKVNMLLPEVEVRQKIIETSFKGFKIEENIAEIFAYMCQGLTGAEIEQICDKSKMDAIVSNTNLGFKNFTKHFFNYIKIDSSPNDTETDIRKKQIEYLKNLNSKYFINVKIAKIFELSKSSITQIMKEVKS